MSKTIRIRTTPNGDDSYLKVKVEQDFDFIKILSLRISQSEAYARYCSDYGVVVGRVIANNGFGVPNAKVSIFVPLTDDDELDSEISGRYPFKNIDDTDDEGIRYNLLDSGNNSHDDCFTPVGTFPSKREIIDNDVNLEIYDKYYKFTTTSNESGDFMLFGVPTGSHIINVDLDLSDIGILSQRPYDYISNGEPSKRFESSTKFKSDKDLDKLVQIKSYKKNVTVQPFWGDKDQCDIGISRVDFDIKKRIVPNAIFIGSLFSDSEKNSINLNCRPRKDFGRLCETETGAGTVEMIRKTLDGKIERFDVEGGRVISESGSWAYQVPMNLDIRVTNEFGDLVPSEDPNKGIATRARVRFRIGKDISGGEGRLRTTAKYLVPHNPDPSNENPNIRSSIDYNFNENTNDKHFRDFHWNKIYSVSNFIPRIQRKCVGDSCADNRNMTGIKDVDSCSGTKTPFPYNRVDTDASPLFLILCIIISIIVNVVHLINSVIIALINGIIKILNGILESICKAIFSLAKFFCGLSSTPEDCRRKGCIKEDGYDAVNNECDCDSILAYVACITIVCGENDVVFAPGCSCEDVTPENAQISSGQNGDLPDIPNYSIGCWAARVSEENGKDIEHWSGLMPENNSCGHPGHNTRGAGLIDCLSIQLAEELNIFEFDFYNDWVNGTLYSFLLKYKKRKRGASKFCDSDCGTEESDNACDNSFLVDTLVHGGTDRIDIKKTTKLLINEGLIKLVKTRSSSGKEIETLYYAPYSIEAGQKLFATELVHLGSILECDWQGIPKIQPFLTPTTYQRPPLIDEFDDDGVLTTSGMVGIGKNGLSGVMFDIDCAGIIVGQIYGKPRADNIKRQCELGMGLDGSILDENNSPISNANFYLNSDDLNQPYAGIVRDMIYQLNINDGPDKLNSWSELPLNIDTGFGNATPSSLNDIGDEYIEYRGIDSPTSYFTEENGVNNYTQPNNSYYYYFGTEPGNSAIDLMNTRFFAPCEVLETNDFAISGVIQNVDIPGECTGTITATISGGEGPYTFNWNGTSGYVESIELTSDEISNEIDSLCAGQYILTVVDSVGGSSTIIFEVKEPSEFNCIVSSTNAISYGSDGYINITVIGGVSPYSYIIDGDSQGTLPSNYFSIEKPSGSYSVIVTDGTGSECASDIEILAPQEFTIDGLADVIDTTCGLDNGEISLNISGGIGGLLPYGFNIEGPNGYTSDLINVSDLEPGIYTITATDSSSPGQTATTEVVISESIPPNFTVTLEMTTPINCPSQSPNGGEATATVTGSNGPYTYVWYDVNFAEIGTDNTITLDNTYCDTTINCVVTDSNGCTISEELIVE